MRRKLVRSTGAGDALTGRTAYLTLALTIGRIIGRTTAGRTIGRTIFQLTTALIIAIDRISLGRPTIRAGIGLTAMVATVTATIDLSSASAFQALASGSDRDLARGNRSKALRQLSAYHL